MNTETTVLLLYVSVAAWLAVYCAIFLLHFCPWIGIKEDKRKDPKKVKFDWLQEHQFRHYSEDVLKANKPISDLPDPVYAPAKKFLPKDYDACVEADVYRKPLEKIDFGHYNIVQNSRGGTEIKVESDKYKDIVSDLPELSRLDIFLLEQSENEEDEEWL